MTVLRILLYSLLLVSGAAAQEASTRFTHFSALLPEGWAGEEQSGFISDNAEEYALTLGKKDDDRFIAQVSIYLLPNKPGKDAGESAKILAEAQGDSSIPMKNGNFWQFTGEPRSRTIRGKALTRVAATPETLLIIIAQDPERVGAEQILESLKGETPKARQMLGQ